MDAEGHLALRLRWRRHQTRVYGADHAAVGAVVPQGDDLHLLDLSWQRGFILRPATPPDDAPEGSRRWVLLPAEARWQSVRRPEDEARLSRLEPESDAPLLTVEERPAEQGARAWIIRRDDDVLARLIRTDADPQAWTLTLARGANPDAPAPYIARASGAGAARTLEVARPADDGDAEVVVLSARDERLTPGAAALALLPEVEPLVRGGLMVLLSQETPPGT